MCGIVGYIGYRDATDVLLEGLKRLEYRGYDSAGIAVRDNGDIVIKRCVGKLRNLELEVEEDKPKGHCGIGHTRWATHGRPSETNAHPHKAGNVILVHNGIIENFSELRSMLAKKGHTFSSETDTEVACHLIYEYYKKLKSMPKSIAAAIKDIRGSYAFVIMDENDPEVIYATKLSSPMVVGIGKDEMFVASDIPAFLSYTRKVIILDDGEFAEIRQKSYVVKDSKGKKITRAPKEITWDHVMAEKGGFKHFMLKEIFEQPKAVSDTMTGRLIPWKNKIEFPELKEIWGGANDKFPFTSIMIIACGTSYHASLVGKYWIEELSRVPVLVDLASEFRYRDPIVNDKTLVIAISQSGETADTLAAVKLAKSKKATVICICNVVDSSIARASAASLYTHAGPEIGVASTKAFTAQLIMLNMFALALGSRLKKIKPEFLRKRIDELLHLPAHMKQVLESHEKVKKIAEKYVSALQVLYIARGANFPVSLEGALKLKEISYMHAEGFAAGELKHGPIALVDHGVPVIALAADGDIYEKMMSNIEEVQARGGDIIALAEDDHKEIAKKVTDVIWVPKSSVFTSPILYTIPLQLFAYYMADYKGTDVDQPRNLAKSVTVE